MLRRLDGVRGTTVTSSGTWRRGRWKKGLWAGTVEARVKVNGIEHQLLGQGRWIVVGREAGFSL